MKIFSLFFLLLSLHPATVKGQHKDSVLIQSLSWQRPIAEFQLSQLQLSDKAQQIREEADSAELRVTFLNNVPIRAQAAITQAADILEQQIASPIPINVHVRWLDLPDNVLGVATALVLDVSEENFFAQQGAFYSVPLLEKLFLQELNGPEEADILITLDRFSPWYLGTDGNPGRLQLDLVTVALHEMVHGLGYIQNVFCDQIFRSCQLTSEEPFKFVSFLSFQNTPLPELEGTALFQAVTSQNVVFSSPQAAEVNGGDFPQIFAPSDYQPGSSLSHLDTETFPMALMRPVFPFGESVRQPSQVSLQMLGDLGWVNTYIIPELLPTVVRVEDFNENLDVPAVVFADSMIVESSLALNYFFDGQQDEVESVTMQIVDAEQSLYSARIPLQAGVSEVSYYISVEDNTGRSFRSPREQGQYYTSEIEQQSTARTLRFFPTPAHKHLVVKGNLQAPLMQVELFNMLGDRLLSEQLSGPDFEKKLSVEHLLPGVYMLKIKGDGVLLKKKVLIR